MNKKVLAVIIGLVCHTLFLCVVSLMAYMIFFGVTKGIFPLGSYGRFWNVLLLLQFPIGHSFLLSQNGRRMLARMLPGQFGRDMLTTTFALVASLQLCAVFLFWSPDGAVWFAASGAVLYIFSGLYALSWLLLIRSLFEAGLSLQTGYLGWLSVVRGKKPEYPPPPFEGLHGRCRQPIYLSFVLILLTAPVWGVDHLILSIVWVSYCLIGPLFKEKRFLRLHGSDFEKYQQSTPYFLPISKQLDAGNEVGRR